MMKLIHKPLVIVGIDPGTTQGYAILDINGNLIKADSARGAGLSELISNVTYYGRPVLVGTDKAKCPEQVYQFAAKTGSKIVCPYADLLISEKKVLAGGYEVRNDHEADALASAIFAHKKYSSMFYKISSYLRNANKDNISDEVKRLIILSDGLSIGDAIRIVEKGEETSRMEGEKMEVPEEFIPTKEDYLRLKEKLKRTEDEYKLLRTKCENLSGELERASKEEEPKAGGLATNRKINRVLRLREKRIKAEERSGVALSKEIGALKRFLSEIGEKVLLKRLDNLSYDEFLKRNKIINVRQGDMLLVENPNNHGQKTFDFIRGKVSVIIYRKEINKDLKALKDFVFLDGSRLSLEEEEDFALAEKGEIERLKKESNSFLGLFERYKESRKKEK
jgi:predicted RNase H-like nuclease (RuvC/YqgF family)